MRRPALAVAGALVIVAAWSSPAFAHAQLLTASPAPGSVVAASPAQIVLRFGEPVEIDFGSIRVFDASGARVDSGGTHHPRGDDAEVAIDLPSRLTDGAYIVAWRVVSADSHPVQGAYTFSVGTSAGLGRASALAARIAAESGSASVGSVFLVVRAAQYAGLLALLGIAAMVLACAPRALGRRRVRRALWGSYALVVVATCLAVCLQGAYAAALPIGDAFRGSLIGEVLATRFGHLALARLALLALAAPLLWALCARRSSRRPGALTSTLVVLASGLLVTTALAGHAATGTWVAVGLAADVVHLAAAALWVGGLVVLACLLLPGGEDDGLDVDAASRRISPVLVAAVAAVVVSGAAQSLRQVGAPGQLIDTTYGRLLVSKAGLVAVLVALGALSRTLLRRRGTQRRPAAGRGGLAKSVAVELAVVAAVLAVTAGLVNAAPPRALVALPYAESYTTLGVQVNVVLAPAASGVRNTLHVYVLTPAGLPRAVPEVDATISFPAERIGPIAVPLTLAGVGHYRSRDVEFFSSGTWVLTVTVRTTAIDEQVTPLLVQVR